MGPVGEFFTNGGFPFLDRLLEGEEFSHPFEISMMREGMDG